MPQPPLAITVSLSNRRRSYLSSFAQLSSAYPPPVSCSQCAPLSPAALLPGPVWGSSTIVTVPSLSVAHFGFPLFYSVSVLF